MNQLDDVWWLVRVAHLLGRTSVLQHSLLVQWLLSVAVLHWCNDVQRPWRRRVFVWLRGRRAVGYFVGGWQMGHVRGYHGMFRGERLFCSNSKLRSQEIPWNLFSPKAPYQGSCISKETITSKTPLVNWETCHVIMDHGGKVPYIEGQSIGIIAPGPDKKGETPAKIRFVLHCIFSARWWRNKQDGLAGGEACCWSCWQGMVRILQRPQGKGPWIPWCWEGVPRSCSSHICDLNAGDDVLITGPTGAEMLLPEDPEANMIFMATGTGIAPFRSHLRYLFHDKVSKGKFKGVAWMFLGVPYSQSILYDEEWKEMQAEYPDQFRYDYAVSGEEKSEKNKINGHWDLDRGLLGIFFCLCVPGACVLLSYSVLQILKLLKSSSSRGFHWLHVVKVRCGCSTRWCSTRMTFGSWLRLGKAFLTKVV